MERKYASEHICNLCWMAYIYIYIIYRNVYQLCGYFCVFKHVNTQLHTCMYIIHTDFVHVKTWIHGNWYASISTVFDKVPLTLVLELWFYPYIMNKNLYGYVIVISWPHCVLLLYGYILCTTGLWAYFIRPYYVTDFPLLEMKNAWYRVYQLCSMHRTTIKSVVWTKDLVAWGEYVCSCWFFPW